LDEVGLVESEPAITTGLLRRPDQLNHSYVQSAYYMGDALLWRVF